MQKKMDKERIPGVPGKQPTVPVENRLILGDARRSLEILRDSRFLVGVSRDPVLGM
jgi:hypothetical protein